jgi:hypothetical protein
MNAIKRVTLIVWIVSLTIPLFGQDESVKPLPLNAISGIEDANKLFHPRPTGGEIDWGLALSGGGIRSGSYSVGVLKALYDKGILDKVDAISTVSEGGYASYWLYGLYDPVGNKKFGERALSDEFFLANSCRLKNAADMQSNWKMIKALVSSRPTALGDYGKSIHRTFGLENEQLKDRRVDYYRNALNSGDAPYFFINASIYSSELADYGRTIEITQDYIGNPLLGYSRWEEGKAINFNKSIAISAAGKPKVRSDVGNFAPYTLCSRKEPSSDDAVDKITGRSACNSETQQLGLWDGGKTENLGALPLIRRGLKNVIIVDAEHDPKYVFDAYVDLKRILESIQIDFSVSEIDRIIGERSTKGADIEWAHPTGVMTGFAKNRVTGQETTVYYLKATRPTEIFPPDIEAKMQPFIKDREKRQAFIKKTYRAGYEAAEKRDTAVGNGSSCDAAPKSPVDPKMYQYLVNYYGYFILQSKLRRISGLLDVDLTYDFPQTTTFDQSFYSDQMEAFIGLGILQGIKLTDIIPNR